VKVHVKRSGEQEAWKVRSVWEAKNIDITIRSNSCNHFALK
jgi:hypothetical protein